MSHVPNTDWQNMFSSVMTFMVLLSLTTHGSPLYLLKTQKIGIIPNKLDTMADITAKPQKFTKLLTLQQKNGNQFYFIENNKFGDIPATNDNDNKRLPSGFVNQAGNTRNSILNRSRRQGNTNTLANIFKIHQQHLQRSNPDSKNVVESTTTSIEKDNTEQPSTPLPKVNVTASSSKNPQNKDTRKVNTPPLDTLANSGIQESFLPYRLRDRQQTPYPSEQRNTTEIQAAGGRQVPDKLLLIELEKSLRQCSRQSDVPESFFIELQKLMEKYSLMLRNTQECDVCHGGLVLVKPGPSRNNSDS